MYDNHSQLVRHQLTPLEACTVTDTDDERFSRLSEMVTDAAEQLHTAQAHLERIHDAAVDIAAFLFPLGADGSENRP